MSDPNPVIYLDSSDDELTPDVDMKSSGADMKSSGAHTMGADRADAVDLTKSDDEDEVLSDPNSVDYVDSSDDELTPANGSAQQKTDGEHPSGGSDAICANALATLNDMGFSVANCERALAAVGGSDVEAATDFLFQTSSAPNPAWNDEAAAAGPKDYEVASLTDSNVVSLKRKREADTDKEDEYQLLDNMPLPQDVERTTYIETFASLRQSGDQSSLYIGKSPEQSNQYSMGDGRGFAGARNYRKPLAISSHPLEEHHELSKKECSNVIPRGVLDDIDEEDANDEKMPPAAASMVSTITIMLLLLCTSIYSSSFSLSISFSNVHRPTMT